MFKNISGLTCKLFIVCFLFVFGTTTLMSQVAYRFVLNEVRSNNDYFVNQMVSKVEGYVSLSYTSLETILYAVDSSYQPGDNSHDGVNGLESELQYLYEVNYNLISNLYIIRNDTSIIGGTPLSPAFEDPNKKRLPIYWQALGNKQHFYTSEPYISDQSGWTVTMAKYLHGSDPETVVALDINLSTIENKLLQINRDDIIHLVIVDENGRLVAGSLRDAGTMDPDTHEVLFGRLTAKELLAQGNNTFEYEQITDGSRKRWTVHKYQGLSMNWSILTLSDDSFTRRSLKHIEGFYALMLAIGLILSAIVAAVVTRYIRKPLGSLMTKMRLIRQGFHDIPVVLDRKDEFGELSRTFDTMLKQIKELVEHLRSNRELRRELEIQVLQSQINPHFLYNTLGSIGNVVSLGMYEQVNPIIKALIKILEYGIEDQALKVTLREELANVRDYIYIQTIRYGNEFVIEEEIEDAMYEYPVFRMLLQPLVENSLFHGYNGGRIPGKIVIRAIQDEQACVIEVIDFGRGMSQETSVQLLHPGNRRHESQRRRIGLLNIHQRIRLNYGEPFGLEIRSKPGQGTTIRALFPKAEDAKGANE